MQQSIFVGGNLSKEISGGFIWGSDNPDNKFCQLLNSEFEPLGGVVVVWQEKMKDN